MDVPIPLLSFLAGLGVHHRWVRWLRATDRVRREELRYQATLLSPVAFAEHLQKEGVRREIEELIQDTRR